MNHQPIQRKAGEWTGWRTRLELTERLTQTRAHVAHHLRRRELAPDRPSVGPQMRDAFENLSTIL
jgi:hypothetical protein